MNFVKLLSFIVLSANIFTFISIICNVFRKNLKIAKQTIDLIDNHSLFIVLVVSLVSTLGSLYFSEIAGFIPCKLCWYQRVLMYPIPIIILTSLVRELGGVFYYLLPISFLGLVLAGFHYYLQLNPNPYAPCQDIGFSVSCSENFFTHFGYITIPWMSFSAFLIIFLISLRKAGKLGR